MRPIIVRKPNGTRIDGSTGQQITQPVPQPQAPVAQDEPTGSRMDARVHSLRQEFDADLLAIQTTKRQQAVALRSAWAAR